MFTVSNRDVIRRILISALLFIFADINPASARPGKISHMSHRSDNGTDIAYNSYETYLHRKKNTSKYSKVQKKQTIIIYTVRRGDTLTRIGKKYSIPVSELRSINKIKSQSNLKTGVKLKIPVQKKPAIKTANKKLTTFPDSRNAQKPKFVWPLKTIIDCRNDGIDGVRPIGLIITGKPGSNVLSSAPGTVIKIGSMRGFGRYIVINHPERYATVYANLGEISVSEGDKVKAGNPIGKMHITERKLHFQIDFEGKPRDPLQYLPKNNNFFY